MFIVSKEFRFEASHRLPFNLGTEGRLHGHSWKLVVAITRLDGALIETGPSTGTLTDLDALSKIVEPIIEARLDHTHLNDSLGLTSPTPEHIAKWVYDAIKGQLPDGVTLASVMVEENPTIRCFYSEGPDESLKQLNEVMETFQQIGDLMIANEKGLISDTDVMKELEKIRK